METINRSIAIIRPKQPFVDWANQLPDKGWESKLSDFQTDCLSLLIPEYDTDDEAKKYINSIALDIFEEELFGWCTYEHWWPKKLTKKMFWEWFEVELHSVVRDMIDEPIIKTD
ncbi:MAG: hypothetical protein ACOYS2_01130 [Patescibacteria group bacterium]